MAEIISTINAGNDENFELLSKKTKKNKKSFPVIQEDPNKIVMTRTIIPNRREVEQRDIDNFVNRIKGNNIVPNKKETKPIKDVNNVEKKKRGRKPKSIESA